MPQPPDPNIQSNVKDESYDCPSNASETSCCPQGQSLTPSTGSHSVWNWIVSKYTNFQNARNAEKQRVAKIRKDAEDAYKWFEDYQTAINMHVAKNPNSSIKYLAEPTVENFVSHLDHCYSKKN
jgi:hypothetical protein